MTIRLDELLIPDFTGTEAALAWGAQQKPEHRPLLRAVYKSLERIALETTDLQRKANYATQAQFIREAAEMVPNLEARKPGKDSAGETPSWVPGLQIDPKDLNLEARKPGKDSAGETPSWVPGLPIEDSDSETPSSCGLQIEPCAVRPAFLRRAAS